MKSVPVRPALAALVFLAVTVCPLAVHATQPASAVDAAKDETLSARGTASARAYPASALRDPIDETLYVVGPGDIFEVTISAGGQAPNRLPVTPEGKLLLPGLGSVTVADFTLQEAKRRVLDELEQSYRNVRVTLSLVAMRRVEIHVTGAVIAPGTYVGTPMDVASSMIAVAGGLADRASRRDIQMRGSGGRVRRVDLTRYERLGDASLNPPVLDSNTLFVPFAKTEVRVQGAVEAPGDYEFVDGDTIASMLEIAGGLRRGALRDSVELRRFVNDRETEVRVLGLTGEAHRIALQDGDQLYVRFTDEFREPKSVLVQGAVHSPGPFGITEGVDRISDVLARAGGITENASPSEARLIRSLAAEKPDLEFERLKTIPIQDMSKTEYAYFKGKAREQKGLVVLDFAKLLQGDSSQDRLLRDGDRIEVWERRETITVSGMVSFPGLIPLLPGKSAAYYVAQAGGYASSADRGRTRVIRGLTGEWESASDAGAVVPGDEIWVPESPERDWWQFTQEAVRFVASLATVYFVVDRAVSN